jgi:ribosome maturation factor RimP
VSLDLCERVSRALSPLREDYTLEVSSPGPQRPLTKPTHFQQFLGHSARVRTRRALEEGRRSFTGELVGASDADVTLAAPTGVVRIPYAEIKRSNLVAE